MKLLDWYSVISIVGGLAIYQVVFYFLRIWARRKKRALPDLLNRYIYYPGMVLSFTIAVSIALLFFESHFKPPVAGMLHHVLRVLIIAEIGFLLIRVFTVLKELAIHHYRIEDLQDYRFRKARTKYQLIQRVLNFVI